MLSQKEVYDIMRTDFLELQRKRIAELELAIYRLTVEIAVIDTTFNKVLDIEIANAKKLLKKGISL